VIAEYLIGYALCSVAAGYATGRLNIDNSVDQTAAAILLSLLGPCGLVLALAIFLSKHGKRHAEISAMRHRVALAELKQQEREIAKLLGGEQ